MYVDYNAVYACYGIKIFEICTHACMAIVTLYQEHRTMYKKAYRYMIKILKALKTYFTNLGKSILLYIDFQKSPRVQQIGYISPRIFLSC